MLLCCSCLISLYVILGVLWFKMSMDTVSLLAVDLIVCFAALGTGKLGLLGKKNIQLNMGRRIGQSLPVRLLTFCYLLLMQSAMRSRLRRVSFQRARAPSFHSLRRVFQSLFAYEHSDSKGQIIGVRPNPSKQQTAQNRRIVSCASWFLTIDRHFDTRNEMNP